jgi:ketosteroid isomerase-like protein
VRNAVLFISLCSLSAVVMAQSATSGLPTDHNKSSEVQAIRQVEAQLLDAERTTDLRILQQICADDYVNLTPTGVGPDKAELLSRLKVHEGEAPPYSVKQQDMRIYVLNDTSAVAAYVKVYIANENGNVARQDATDVFTKDHGSWRLRFSKISPHASGS